MLVTRAWIHMMAVKQFLYVCAYGTVSVHCRIFNCIKQNFTFFCWWSQWYRKFLIMCYRWALWMITWTSCCSLCWKVQANLIVWENTFPIVYLVTYPDKDMGMYWQFSLLLVSKCNTYIQYLVFFSLVDAVLSWSFSWNGNLLTVELTLENSYATLVLQYNAALVFW